MGRNRFRPKFASNAHLNPNPRERTDFPVISSVTHSCPITEFSDLKEHDILIFGNGKWCAKNIAIFVNHSENSGLQTEKKREIVKKKEGKIIQGDKGDKGDKGIQGDHGLQGDKGDHGLQGDKGDQGIQGDKGDQGIQGDKGDQGIQGDKGDQGIQGLQGDQGIQGLQGEQGLQGNKGD